MVSAGRRGGADGAGGRRARPDLATTMACGPLDELVALHDELGHLRASCDELEVARERAGLPDGLLLRTLATLPFLAEASLSGAAGALFREPALLLRLGWAPVAIRAGSNGRHRHPAGRQPESLPCHPDTLRDALRRVGEAAWARAQRAGVGRPLRPAAGAGRGLRHRRQRAGAGPAGGGVGLRLRRAAGRSWPGACLDGERPRRRARRRPSRAPWSSRRGAGGRRGTIRLLLADALYADGPLLGLAQVRPRASTPWCACRPTAASTKELEALAAADGLAWRDPPRGAHGAGAQGPPPGRGGGAATG